MEEHEHQFREESIEDKELRNWRRKIAQKIDNGKVYKYQVSVNDNMFPSDPTGSLDDFRFISGGLNGKNIGFS